MNFNKKRLAFCAVFFGVFFACAGFAGCSRPRQSAGQFAVQELAIERDGAVIAAVLAEIAVTDEERSLGLMHRQSLDDGKGMLFVFDRDQILSFWMKNTYIPLSIAFIAWDGRILEIRDMQPHDLNPVRSSRSVRYALEVPQNWFSRAKVNLGDVVIIPGF